MKKKALFDSAKNINSVPHYLKEISSLFLFEKKRLLISVVSVVLLGLIAHAYCYTNLTLSHDSLNEWSFFGPINYSDGTVIDWKISLGRYIVPLYQVLFHFGFTSPWLSGVLSLLWLSLSVWLLLVIFDITEIPIIILVAGIFVLNPTYITLAATYIHDLDVDMFAVFMGVLAVYLWSQNKKISLFSILPIFLILGIYQSMLSVVVALVMIVCIMSLLEGVQFKTVFLSGINAALFVIIAGVSYLLVFKIVCLVTSVTPETGYNGVNNLLSLDVTQYPKYLLLTYKSWTSALLQSFIWPWIILAIINLILIIIGLFIFIFGIQKKNLAISSKIGVIAAGLLLPLGMNISFIIDGGMVHLLMMYSIWLIYVFFVLLVRWYLKNNNRINETRSTLVKLIVGITLICFLWGCVITANTAYVKKDLERQATLSIMTEVCTCIDSIDGYVPGETKVAFIGTPNLTNNNELSQYFDSLTGLSSKSTITGETYKSYFNYILKRQINICDSITRSSISKDETVIGMPPFPSKESIMWYKGMLVVKMS